MPSCPRCGKSLSTNQALDYHLNKKFKCALNSCQICKKQFETKTNRDNHYIYCRANQLYKAFCEFENEDNVFILDKQMNILKASNSTLINTEFKYNFTKEPFSKPTKVVNNQVMYVKINEYDNYVIAIYEKLEKNSAN